MTPRPEPTTEGAFALGAFRLDSGPTLPATLRYAVYGDPGDQAGGAGVPCPVGVGAGGRLVVGPDRAGPAVRPVALGHRLRQRAGFVLRQHRPEEHRPRDGPALRRLVPGGEHQRHGAGAGAIAGSPGHRARACRGGREHRRLAGPGLGVALSRSRAALHGHRGGPAQRHGPGPGPPATAGHRQRRRLARRRLPPRRPADGGPGPGPADRHVFLQVAGPAGAALRPAAQPHGRGAVAAARRPLRRGRLPGPSGQVVPGPLRRRELPGDHAGDGSLRHPRRGAGPDTGADLAGGHRPRLALPAGGHPQPGGADAARGRGGDL